MNKKRASGANTTLYLKTNGAFYFANTTLYLKDKHNIYFANNTFKNYTKHMKVKNYERIPFFHFYFSF